MIPVFSAADVRALDAAAEQAGTPVALLMENAGWAVARAARGMLGGAYGRRVVVLVGKGNNAGDGLVAGRILRSMGAHVTAVLSTDPSSMSELAALNLERLPGPTCSADRAEHEIARADLVIDALLGVGLSRTPDGAIARLIELSATPAPVLSVDIPSGVDSDTGAIPSAAVRADRTVTLAGLKPGLLFEPGASHAGEVEVAAIGTPPPDTASAMTMRPRDVAEYLPRRSASSHKRNVGTVLVVAGSRAMPGAAALAVGAVVHAGAGLTVLCAPEDVCRVALGRVPEITTIPVPESPEGTIDGKALDLVGPRMGEFDAVAVGPGLSTHPATVEFVRALVAATDRPLVLDADGLNAFAGSADLVRARSAPTVLTPHAGELSRLLGVPAKGLEADRLGTAARAVRELDCCIVFKGPGTVIADESRRFINASGGSALAQGGTGDVLTGIIAPFIAAGDRLVERAAAAVAIHGMAADRIAARAAPHPANASALIDELGPTMHDVLYG